MRLAFDGTGDSKEGAMSGGTHRCHRLPDSRIRYGWGTSFFSDGSLPRNVPYVYELCPVLLFAYLEVSDWSGRTESRYRSWGARTAHLDDPDVDARSRKQSERPESATNR